MVHFHNTTHESGSTLTEYERKARTQAGVVSDFFKLNPGEQFTPFEVWDKLIQWEMIDPKTPLTSIRRAMTNLVDSEFLIMKKQLKIERLGRGNHVWELKTKYEQTRLF